VRHNAFVPGDLKPSADKGRRAVRSGSQTEIGKELARWSATIGKGDFWETNMSTIVEREQALSILTANAKALSQLYRECFLSEGKGALLVYAEDIIEGKIPAKWDYRSREEMLEIFDKPESHDGLAKMIDNYEPNKEGIMTLITSYSNATFFVRYRM
jgi:hypothetical protein